MRPVGVLLLSHDTDLSHARISFSVSALCLSELLRFMTFGLAADSEELNYRSCCCRQAFMALT